MVSTPSTRTTHTYAYDLAGNRITVTYGGTGTVLTSSYDVLNRLSTLSETPALSSQLSTLSYPRVTTYGYDLNGNRVLQQMPNGETVTTQFDALNRQAAETTAQSTGTLVLQLTQVYDRAGNIKQITENYPGSTLAARTVTNTYDGINRLVGETAVQGATTTSTAYVFDAAHNRTQKAVSTNTGTTVGTTYTYNTLNQLVSSVTGSTTTVYTYDLNGNRATMAVGGLTDAYGYDYENRLVTLAKNTVGGVGTYAYAYDYRTRRVTREETTGATTTVTQVVFSGGVSVAEYEGAVVQAEFIRGSDWGGGVGGLLYSVRSGQPSFNHYNSRGDVITQTNATGSATWQASYEAFGTRTQEVGTTQDRQKANTKEEDPTGLLNEGFRYRDLATGSFITRDPLGFVDGPNMYAYVLQNPWSKFDPEGLSAADDAAAKEAAKKAAEEAERKRQEEAAAAAEKQKEAPTVRYPKEKQDEAEAKTRNTQNPGGASAREVKKDSGEKDIWTVKTKEPLPDWVKSPGVQSEVEKAWIESNPHAPAVPLGQPGSLKTEQGGWVVKNPLWDGLYTVVRVPNKERSRDSIDFMGTRPEGDVVGRFHTHPNTKAEGYRMAPSPIDRSNQFWSKVPEIVRAHDGVHFMPYP